MKLLYISSVNPKLKSGYYNAVADRLLALQKINTISLTSLNYAHHHSDLFNINIRKPWYLVQRGPSKYFENLFIYRKLLSLLKIIRPDVVHVHWCYPIGYCTVKACKKLNIPCVMTCHGSDIHSNPLKNAYIKSKSEWALKNTSANIFVSTPLYNQAEQLFGAIPAAEIIPNALNISTILSSMEQKSTCNIKQVSYIGNLNTTKGADLLPSIFNSINKSLPKKEIAFTIAGQGPLKHEIEEQLNKLSVPTTMLGHITRSDSLKLINKSDLVIIPSRHEGFGIVALEAFILKTPCIGFNIPGLADVFKGNEHLLVPFLSIQHIASKSINVLDGNEKIDYARYISEYDITNTIQHELNLYNSIINPPKLTSSETQSQRSK